MERVYCVMCQVNPFIFTTAHFSDKRKIVSSMEGKLHILCGHSRLYLFSFMTYFAIYVVHKNEMYTKCILSPMI